MSRKKRKKEKKEREKGGQRSYYIPLSKDAVFLKKTKKGLCSAILSAKD